MKPGARLPLALGALALALALLAGASVLIVGVTLEPAERAAIAALLAPRAMLAVMLWLAVFGVAAWGLSRAFERFVQAPARLHEQAQALLADAGAGPIEPHGSAANRALAESVNAFVRERALLRDDIAQQVAQASRGIEQERARLAALMAELTQSVLVCNRDGRIVLVNGRARAQFRAWSRTPATAGGAELIGIGRSIYAVFDRELVAHALETIDRRARAGVIDASAQFVTTTAAGRLLRVQMTAVRQPDAPQTASGFVLMLDDITAEAEQQALRDRLLLGLTEGSRASLGNLQAAVEMLELPDLDAAMRERFQRVVRDEVAAMTQRLHAAAADLLAGLKTRWPLEDIHGADLLAAAQRRIEALGVHVDAEPIDPQLWLEVDSYSLLLALACLAGRLADEFEVRSLRLRLTAAPPRGDPAPAASPPAGTRAWLDLVWSGAPVSTETAMGWHLDAMRSGSDATPLTLRDVVERHGGEFWFERERVRHEAFFRFLLPCAVARDEAGAAPPARTDERPEFYDFDLFRPTPQAAALDERALAELAYTVFDTETTGLNPSAGDEIIQIGATRIVNGKLLRQECFDQLVDPRRVLAEASAAIHGIRAAALVGQPTILEVLPVFHAFALDTVLVAHNAAFDMRFLELKQAASGLRFDQAVLDTLLLSAWLQPNQESHSLDAIAQRMGVAASGRHTALGDALLTAEVFLRMIPLLQARGVHTLGQARAAAQQTYQARLKY